MFVNAQFINVQFINVQFREKQGAAAKEDHQISVVAHVLCGFRDGKTDEKNIYHERSYGKDYLTSVLDELESGIVEHVTRGYNDLVGRKAKRKNTGEVGRTITCEQSIHLCLLASRNEDNMCC